MTTELSSEDIENIQAIFTSQPTVGFECLSEYLYSDKFNSFDEFIKYWKENGHISCCTASWSTPHLSVHCKECGIENSSCICLDCYRKGNHQGHCIYLEPYSCGNCDCGDVNLWRPEGFCSCHSGTNPQPENELDLSDRVKFLSVFKCAFTILANISVSNPSVSIGLLKWLSNFPPLSDGIRRCAAIALQPLFKKIWENANLYNPQLADFYIRYFGLICNDHYFLNYFSEAVIETIRSDLNQIIHVKNESKSKFYAFSFHAFSFNSFLHLLFDTKWDWCDFFEFVLSNLNEILFKQVSNLTVFFDEMNFFSEMFSRVVTTIGYFIENPTEMQKLLPNQSVQKLVNTFVDIFAETDYFLLISGNQISEPSDTTFYLFYMILTEYFSFKFTNLSSIDPTYLIKTLHRCIDQLFHRGNFDNFPDHPAISEGIISQFHQDESMNFLGGISSENIKTSLSEARPKNETEYAEFSSFNNIITHSVISKATFSSMHVLEQILSSILKSNPDLIPKVFADESSFRLILNSVRLIAAYFINSMHKFPIQSRVASVIFRTMKASTDNYISTFSLLQMCAGSTPNKDFFLEMLFYAFGLHECDEFLLPFLFLTSLLASDRTALLGTSEQIATKIIESRLATKPKTLEKLNKSTNFLKCNIIKIIASIATKNGPTFKLKKQFECLNLMLPITKLIQLKTLQFQPWEPEPFNLNLVPLLTSPVLIATEFSILADPSLSKKHELDDFVKTLINYTSSIVNVPLTKKEEVSKIIFANTRLELIHKFSGNFATDISTPVAFRGNEPVSILDLLKINVTTIDNDTKKKLANDLKKSIMSQYSASQKQFWDSLGMTVPSDEIATNIPLKCTICSESVGDLSLPVYVFRRVLEGVESIGFHMCQHPLHKDCADYRLGSIFLCPAERLVRNCIINIEPDLESALSLAQTLLLIKEKKMIDDPIMAGIHFLFSFSELFREYDFRLRADPGSLDKIIPLLLPRLLMKNLENLNMLIDPDEIHNPFMKIIYDISLDRSIPLKSLIGSLGSDFVALRRARIFEIMCLENEYDNLVENFINNGVSKGLESTNLDWDFELMPDELFKHFKIQPFAVPELPLFKLIDLPKDFLKIDAPISDRSVINSMRLDTGEILDTFSLIKSYNCATPFIQTSGKELSAVFVYSDQTIAILPGIYLDAFGEEDIGIQRRNPLYLSSNRYSQITDMMLSGAWADYIKINNDS